MSEDTGNESLEETQRAGVDEEENLPGYPLPLQQPRPISAPLPKPVAPILPEPAAPAARTSEDETLAKIIESLGGRDQARKLTLSVKRRRRGEPWKQLRPVPVEDWMVQEGLSAAEVIGDQYGNGSYKWELRTQGRYCASGFCDLEGFDHVPDEKILSDDEVIEPPATETQTIPVGELVQGAVAAAMAPMAELVGSLRGDLTAILSAKLNTPPPALAAPTPPQADPALQTLIGILAQQNTALFEIVGKGFSERMNPAPVAPAPQEESFKSSMRHFKEIIGLTNLLRGPAAPVPEFPTSFHDVEEEFEEPGDTLTFPETEEEQATLLGRAGSQLGDSLERVLSNFLRYGEEKLQSEVLGLPAAQDAATPTTAPAAQTVVPTELAGELERIFALIDQCVREGVTVEEFREHLLPRVPDQLVSLVQTGKLDATDLIELSKFLGKPEMTRRIAEPEVQRYLNDLFAVINLHE